MKLPFFVFLAISAYFLWAEHQAHVIEFLPWILILGCIGMHLFMHGSHKHGSCHHDKNDSRSSQTGPSEEG